MNTNDTMLQVDFGKFLFNTSPPSAAANRAGPTRTRETNL
jgi:hypothetical protein